MIPVVWYSDNPDAISRGYWDQGWLEHFFRTARGYKFTHHASARELASDDGAVLVVPARWHADGWMRIQKQLHRLKWVVLILTGDEENVFPRHKLRHDRMRKWVQTPHTLREGERGLGDMWPPALPNLIQQAAEDKDVVLFHSGQSNTSDRHHMQRVFADHPDVHKTDGFGKGMEYADYIDRMLHARSVLCPGGPFTPDSFRFFETLETGGMPIVIEHPYWNLLLQGGPLPFPQVKRWEDAQDAANAVTDEDLAHIHSWWQMYKRHLAFTLLTDIEELSGQAPHREAADKITAIMPTSSSPSDPSIEHIVETMGTVHKQLPGVEVLVMMDGLHPDHAHRKDAYDEYRRRVAWLCQNGPVNAVPLFFDEHLHQAEMTRRTLHEVRTPFTLFVEHDAPLTGPIPWDGFVDALNHANVDIIRLHHEASVLPDHEHLMVGPTEEVRGVPLRKTVQWSQRPHLANTALYRRIIEEHFRPEARTMIEDVMHGVVHNHWRDFGLAGWDRFELWMYVPKGDIKRSYHLDTRQGEPKVAMTT